MVECYRLVLALVSVLIVGEEEEDAEDEEEEVIAVVAVVGLVIEIIVVVPGMSHSSNNHLRELSPSISIGRMLRVASSTDKRIVGINSYVVSFVGFIIKILKHICLEPLPLFV